MAYLQESQVQETLLILMRSYKMTTNYEVLETISGGQIIKKINENGTISFIPTDEGNSDYQAYLKSLEDEANTL